jgi:multidrug resistance efflux pump
MSDKLERELDTAQAQLQKLLDERDTLSAQLEQASGAEIINVKALVELQRRADEIPLHVYAATVRAARARIIVLEEKLVAEQEVEQYELAVTNEFHMRLQAAQAAYDEAVIERDGARTQVMFTRGDLSSARRELERVVSENTRPHAPVVRSLPHAIRAA